MSRIIRELNAEFPIHITARSNNREHFPLPLDQIWQILTDYLFMVKLEFNFKIMQFVLMPNHYHLVAMDPDLKMSLGMEWFMRETSREIGRRSGRINKIWGAPYHSSIIKSPLYYLHAYKYVYRNPVKAGICQSVLDYHFSTIRSILGFRHCILPTETDHTLTESVEGTLGWLDTPYKDVEEESIRRALKKREFKFRKDPSSRSPLVLEDWESVPYNLRNYRK